jgi:hypothetical protein
MGETHILARLLWTYFPWNWEFDSALSKLRNLGGGGLTPPRYTTGSTPSCMEGNTQYTALTSLKNQEHWFPNVLSSNKMLERVKLQN